MYNYIFESCGYKKKNLEELKKIEIFDQRLVFYKLL